MEKPIRVLQVMSILNQGGAENMVMNLYRAIDREQIQFDFIVHTNDQGAFDNEVEAMGGVIYRAPRYKGTNHLHYVKWWKDFLAGHSEYKILHSHIRSYASVYIPIAKKHGLKTIIHSHSTSNGKGFSAFIKKILQYPLRYQADYLFACSKEAGEWLFGKRAVQSSKYYMIKNSIDTELYKFRPEIRKTYREQLELKECVVYIHVGRFHPSKNHIFLIKVFSEIHKAQSDSVLLLVGDGELCNTIETCIKELGLTDSVRLLGKRTDVPNLLQAADCFLFPSAWEGLPVSVVEAQAAGLPCFVSDTVTKDVNLSGLVKYLPINEGPDIWAEEILNSELSRKDVTEDIKNAGFNVSVSAKKLTDFYLELYHG